MAPRPSAAAAALVVALLGSLLAGCAADPPSVSPAGVDMLEIPTPAPDPADYVATVDNPWLPLLPGSEWVYETEDRATVTVTVGDGTQQVAGVATTAVRRVVRDGDGSVVEEDVDRYAQDRDGNVWHLAGQTARYDPRGRATAEASWEAGVDGARAGVAMLGEPRRGDGYAQQHAPGVAEDRATVVSVDGATVVGSGSYDDLVVVEETSPLEPGLVEQVHHAPGLGPVLAETVRGGSGRAELVEFTAGSAAR